MSDVAARNRRNKRNGTAWESALRDQLRDCGSDIEKLRLNGTEDEGDLVIRTDRGRVMIEAKSGAMHPAEFVREATTEARNYEKHRGLEPGSVTGVAVIKARGKGVRGGYVLTTVEEFFGLH